MGNTGDEGEAEMNPSSELSRIRPRVLIVSRRTFCKNKFVDIVDEFHLDLIVAYGAVPVIVPRVTGIHTFLESFEPIHGVLLCEGEDVNPARYADVDTSGLLPEQLEEIWRLQAGDTAIDHEKYSIELRLAKLCLERNIPFLGICRGSQVLNVACGGKLYQDIEKEVSAKCRKGNATVHIDYDNYDGHRHRVRVEEGTPLHAWFGKSFKEGKMEICVNSYHHQGVKRLAERFMPMAFAPDGLIEGFYDPNSYNPEEGKFIMGLQFQPDRMRYPGTDEFDYPGCAATYEEFVKAVIAYQKKVYCATNIKDRPKFRVQVMEALEAKSIGDAAFRRKEYNKAIEAYTQSIDLNPYDATVLASRSQSWLRLGQGEPALSDAKACRALRPDWPKARFWEGSALSLLNRIDEATDVYFEAVHLAVYADKKTADEMRREREEDIRFNDAGRHNQ